MKNRYDIWLENNAPAGKPWTGRLLALAAAGTATALLGLSVVLMAGLGLPAGEAPLQARAPAPAPAQAPVAAPSVRYAQALPTVTIAGRREVAVQPVSQATTAALPAQPASVENATVGISVAGDNLRQ